MAPRRSGGGGGGGISISSSACSENGAFYDTSSKAFVACWAAFIVVYIGLLISYGVVRKRHAASKNILNWSYVGLSMLFYLFSYIALLVILVLSECGSITYLESNKGTIAVQVFARLGDILLLGAILLSLTPYLQLLIGSNPKPIKIIHGIVLALVGALMIAYVAIDGYNLSNYEAFYSSSDALYSAESKLGAATYILYTLAVGLAVVMCFITLVQMNSRRVAPGGLTVLIPLLSISMLLWPILIVVLRVYYGLQNHNLTITSNIVFEYLIDTFQALVFVFLLLIAGSRAVAAGAGAALPNGTQPIYDPVNGTQYQPVYGQTQYQPPSQPGYQGYGGYGQQPPTQQYSQQPPQTQQYAYQPPPQPYQQQAVQAPEVRHELPK